MSHRSLFFPIYIIIIDILLRFVPYFYNHIIAVFAMLPMQTNTHGNGRWAALTYFRKLSMIKRNLLPLGIAIALLQGIGLMLGLLTKNNINPWYNELIKSNLTPPPIVFSVAWTLLYFLLAIVGWWIWSSRKTPKMNRVWYVYLVQLLMNWLWTPVFFNFHWLGLGFVWILVLTGLTAYLIYRLYSQNKWIALLVVPYLIWLMFASYLNGFIWWFN